MTREAGINVLLITADQFRADCLSAAGHPLVKTPNLDRLAQDGALFSRHFGQCPPCGPSRTSLLTGMYQMNHRSVQNGTPLDGSFTNIALMARAAGYTPWLIGYTDTALDPRLFDFRDPRVRRYCEILPGLEQYAPGSEEASGDTGWRLHLRDNGYANWNEPFRQKAGWEKEAQARGPSYAPIELKAEHSDTAYTTDRALRFFRQNEAAPWFLHVSYLRPHPPLLAPEPYNALYRLEDVPDFKALASIEDEKAIHPFMPFRLDRLEMNPKLALDGPHPNDNPHWRQARATYYGLVTEIDDNIGRIVRALKDSGAYERTLIIFTSDHGEMLGDHWCWGKETPFDQSVHVPFIVRSPTAPASARGRVVDAFSEHVDIMPTVLDHLDVEIPLQCDGRSVRPFLEGGTPSRWRDDVRWEYDFRSIRDEGVDRSFGLSIDELNLAVLRTEKGKYVHFSAMPPLYYDLAADPHELDNRAADPASAPRMLELARRMLTWRMVFNRRELTGIRVQKTGPLHADRSRRVL
jgi:arylsulfatase A-like enzyme